MNELPWKIVRFLTLRSLYRRNSDGLRDGIRLLLLAVLATGPAANGDGTWHDVEDIASTAESFLASNLAATDKRVSAKAGMLDPRLKLARCDVALEAFVRRGTKVASRTIVGVRCNGLNPWKLYVPVDVIVTEEVLVAIRGLPKGHQLTAADLSKEQRDISGLATGYLTGIEQLNGRRLKHPILAGRLITPSMLQADVVVQRGQSVTLLVKNSTLNISMTGKALSDGVVNERIRVENVATGRVIEGVVRSPQHVEILVY